MSTLFETRQALITLLAADVPLIKTAVDEINAEVGTENAENIAAIKEVTDALLALFGAAADTDIATDIANIQAAVDAGFALTGDAVVGNVLDGKTFYKDNYQTKLTGTMPNNAGDVSSVSAHMDATTNLHVVPAAGYTDGINDATTVDLAVVDSDLAAGNVKHGVAVLGVTGTYDTEAGNPIAAGTVLDTKVGFVNGTKITGSMPNNAGDVASISAHMDAGTNLHVVPAEGYTDGSDDATTVDLAVVDADLAAGNVKHGVALLGVTGSYDTEAGDPIAAGTVLDGKIGFVNGTKITGTMPNQAGDNAAQSLHAGAPGSGEIHVVPAEGYVDGSDDAVIITDADFVAANIKHNVNVFGVVGAYDTEASHPIAAGTVLADQIGFVNGAKVTGTMANNAGAVAAVSASITAGTTLSVIPATGYTDGSDDTSTIDLTTVDVDLVTGNIKAGVTILGVAGKTEVVDTTEAGNPAAAGDIANGKVAFVNGVKITGTVV